MTPQAPIDSSTALKSLRDAMSVAQCRRWTIGIALLLIVVSHTPVEAQKLHPSFDKKDPYARQACRHFVQAQLLFSDGRLKDREYLALADTAVFIALDSKDAELRRRVKAILDVEFAPAPDGDVTLYLLKRAEPHIALWRYCATGE